jgi:hypothetical protein
VLDFQCQNAILALDEGFEREFGRVFMGMFLKEYDIYIGSFLEMLNLRFAPRQISEDGAGGVEEMTELQSKFHIFAEGRTFRECVSVLGLGGLGNWRAKNRWFKLLDWLEKVPSDTTQYGGPRIVSVIADNLASANPSPMHFTQHDMAKEPGVLVRFAAKPHFYFIESFIVISLPMAPRKP